LDATSLTARRRRAATVGAQRRPLKGMPNRHGIHLTNVFSFNELTKVSPCRVFMCRASFTIPGTL
jgi:hypothetical protein